MFTPIALGSRQLTNRFIRSATCEYLADEAGRPGARLVDLYRRLAHAGIGLVITGYAYVMVNGRSNPGQSGIYSDGLIPAWKTVTGVFRESPSLFLLQLVHGGRQVRPKYHEGPIWAPSAVPDSAYKTYPEEMTPDQIQGVIDSFIRSAVRAEKAGFDGIQLHAAHGYLLSQFISPYTNRRTDGYGGDQKRRTRLVVEITEGIRLKVKDTFILSVKLNGEDLIPGGLSLEQASISARLIKDAGIDFIEVSGGMAESPAGVVRKNISRPDQEGYFRNHARLIRRQAGIPTAVVGGFRTLWLMNEVIDSGDADFVSLSRPFIREPDLVSRLDSGIQDRAACISCNRCFNPRGLACWQLSQTG